MSANVGSGSESGVVILRCGSLWADTVGNTERARFGDISVETPSRYAHVKISSGELHQSGAQGTHMGWRYKRWEL